MKQSLPEHDPLRHWLEHGGTPPEGVDPELLRALEETGKFRVPETGLSIDEAWRAFKDRHLAKEAPVVRSLWRRALPWAAAILVLCALGASFFLGSTASDAPLPVTFATSLAENSTVTLPDGSTVELNAVSRLTFDQYTWQENRVVSLEGEAFFDVMKGSDFVVSTPGGKVVVLGTSFNVYARENAFEVACLTGSVKVIPQTSEQGKNIPTLLEPGFMYAQSVGEEASHRPIADQSPAAWRKGEFYFDNAPLNEVIAVLERQFGVHIDVDVSTERFYTGSFTRKSMQDAFALVCKPLDLQVKALGEKNYRFSEL